MASFAQVADLEAFTGQTLNTTQAQQALNQSTGLIQGWCGQTLSQVINDTVVLDPLPQMGVFLPELPVTGVSSFAWWDDVYGTGWNTIPTNQYRSNRRGELYIVPNQGFNPHQWPRNKDTLQVVYTHGYTAIPNPIYDVCIALAARLLINPYKLQSSRTGGVQVVYTGVREASELLDTEQKALDRFTTEGFA